MSIAVLVITPAILAVATSVGLLWRARVRHQMPEERYRRSVPHLQSRAIAHYRKYGEVYKPVPRLMLDDWGPGG